MHFNVYLFVTIPFLVSLLSCKENSSESLDLESSDTLRFNEVIDANGYQEQWYENSAAQYDSIYKKFDSAGRLRVTGMYENGKKVGKWYSTLIYLEGVGYEPYRPGSYEETWYENGGKVSRYLRRAELGDSTKTRSEIFDTYIDGEIFRKLTRFDSEGRVTNRFKYQNDELVDTAAVYEKGVLKEQDVYHEGYTETLIYEGFPEQLAKREISAPPYGDVAREEWYKNGVLIRSKDHLQPIYLENEDSMRVSDENGDLTILERVPWKYTPWIKD